MCKGAAAYTAYVFEECRARWLRNDFLGTVQIRDQFASSKMSLQVVQPINGDPFIGMLETPVTSSPLVANFLSNLPAYRTGVSPLLRGVEVGLAHGLLLTGRTWQNFSKDFALSSKKPTTGVLQM